jgi:hypothetical protein
VIAPEPAPGINQQTGYFPLLGKGLLLCALIFAGLEFWRPYFFQTDDNLDGIYPFFVQMGQNLLAGHSPFISQHFFGGNYNALRDPASFVWHPLYLLTSLLAGTPFRTAMVDIDAFFLYQLAAAGFLTLAWHLRREMTLDLSDGWILFFTISYTFTMIALTTGASWLQFLGNISALPWLALGIVQKRWWPGIGLVTLFCLHQLLAGHLSPTTSNTLFLFLFAVALSVGQRSWRPVGNLVIGYAIAVIVLLPLLLPMLSGFFASYRSQGVLLTDMQENNVPAPQFLTSLLFGASVWMIKPSDVTYTLALGASAGIWCFIPAFLGRTRWNAMEAASFAMMLFGALLIIRPTWVSEVMLHLPILRSMRWPFREFVQFQFFLHLFLLVRRPGLTAELRRFTGIFGGCIYVLQVVGSNAPPTFNPMNWDRELVLSGECDRYWDQVRPLLKPTDRVAVLIPFDLYSDDRFEEPYSLLGTFNYAALADIVNTWGYSPTAPRDQLYTKTYAFYPFGAYRIEQKDALMAEKPDLKFITLVSLHPLKITLSSRDGPTIDLTPYVPPRTSAAVVHDQ